MEVVVKNKRHHSAAALLPTNIARGLRNKLSSQTPGNWVRLGGCLPLQVNPGLHSCNLQGLLIVGGGAGSQRLTQSGILVDGDPVAPLWLTP